MKTNQPKELPKGGIALMEANNTMNFAINQAPEVTYFSWHPTKRELFHRIHNTSQYKMYGYTTMSQTTLGSMVDIGRQHANEILHEMQDDGALWIIPQGYKKVCKTIPRRDFNSHELQKIINLSFYSRKPAPARKKPVSCSEATLLIVKDSNLLDKKLIKHTDGVISSQKYKNKQKSKREIRDAYFRNEWRLKKNREDIQKGRVFATPLACASRKQLARIERINRKNAADLKKMVSSASRPIVRTNPQVAAGPLKPNLFALAWSDVQSIRKEQVKYPPVERKPVDLNVGMGFSSILAMLNSGA